ncbi:putative phosphoinositide phosphatase (Sac1) [Tuber indicum]|nr:putative phosphoinositide phosphatase (Sac1) [Tuber indicum]
MAPVNPFRDINITTSPSRYAFGSPSSPNAPVLVVDRPSGDMRLVESPISRGKRIGNVAGVLGVIRLRLDKYIIIITKAVLVGRIRGHAVYKVHTTKFLPLQERQLHDPDEDTYLSLLRTHLRTGPMYFSYTFDLTNSFQRQSSADISLPLWQQADERFFWNRYIQSDLIDLRGSNPAADPFILPVFFGFLSITMTALKSTPLSFILITRRSRHRAGTRYFTRGVDESGNVANFNETEQIVIIGDSTGGLGGYDQYSIASGGKASTQQAKVFSFVQTRGSVPVYWAEVNNLCYTPELQVRGVDSAMNSARKHFDHQIRLYGDNYLVNLVNQKGREQRVKAAYEHIVKLLVSSHVEGKEGSKKTPERFRRIEPTKRTNMPDQLHYVYFDFHHECGGMEWHRAQLLLEQLGDGLYDQYFHSVEGKFVSSDIRSYQTSVVRTNCMDCLDRTNVVQSMLARRTLNRQMVDAGVLGEGENAASFNNFEVIFRSVWADNADVVSRTYSGTGALKTDLTRTGVRTKAGAIADLSSSITRYFRNNFSDGPRQDAYDLFLGVHLPSSTSMSSLLFIDRRPIMIQSIPYVLCGAILLELAAFVLPLTTDESPLSMRIFVLFWLAVALWATNFITKHGKLYVNWPRLNTPSFAVQGYNEELRSAKKDLIIGKWIGRGGNARERDSGAGGSGRLVHLEEGKKRIE